MMPPSFTQQDQNQAWQQQFPTSQYISGQVQNESNAASLTRRRGATVGGFEKIEGDPQTDPSFWQKDNSSNAGSTTSNVDLPFTPGIETNSVMGSENTGLLYDVIAPRVNSLSQPATPEATYRFHASMLTHELATNSSASAGQPSPQE